jgi:tRNA-splicing ligase RtcB
MPACTRAPRRDAGVAALVGGDLDEAPQAYRRLPDVLAHHAGTVEIEHRLTPFAVAMAGADVFDPFKD